MNLLAFLSLEDEERHPLAWPEEHLKCRLHQPDWVVHRKEVPWQFERPGRSETPRLSAIDDAIETSRAILAFEINWDGEGSEGYSEIVWKRATDFLSRYAQHVLSVYGILIDPPRIGPGPQGSIDIHWKTASFELLVNFPNDPHEQARFYGDDYGSQTLKGSFDPSQFNVGLLTWFVEHR